MSHLGTIVTTSGIDNSMQANAHFSIFVTRCFERYLDKDWGELSPRDYRANTAALKSKKPARILASYNLHPTLLRPTRENALIADRDGVTNQKKIWIITEADRSVTTILFPSEY